MKRIFYILTAVMTAFMVSCSVENGGVPVEEKPTVQPVTADVLDGELLVRFDARVSDILDKAGVTKSGPAAPMKRSGVLSVDEILDLVDGYQIERVFPVDARSEEKARQEGLHLWYVVRFSDEHPVEKVAADLAALGEVSRVEYNRTLKKAAEGSGRKITERPFPVQSPVVVARRMVKGMERGKKFVNPSKLFVFSKVLMAVCPPIKWAYLALEKKKLTRFLAQKAETEKAE